MQGAMCDLKTSELILSSVTGVPGLPLLESEVNAFWGGGIDLERTWQVNSVQGYLQ